MRHRHRPASIDSAKLIEEIKKFPALYDRSNAEYRNMDHKNAAWGAISAVIQRTPSDCQLRWTSLRGRFVREKKSYKEDPSRKITWPLYYQLAFLTYYVSHRSRSKCEYNSDLDSSDNRDALDAPKHDEDVYNSLKDDFQYNTNGSSSGLGIRVGDISVGPVSCLPHSKKSAVTSLSLPQKRPFHHNLMTVLLSKLVNKAEPDEDEQFFLAIAKLIKRVPIDKRTALKMKIIQVIAGEEIT